MKFLSAESGSRLWLTFDWKREEMVKFFIGSVLSSVCLVGVLYASEALGEKEIDLSIYEHDVFSKTGEDGIL